MPSAANPASPEQTQQRLLTIGLEKSWSKHFLVASSPVAVCTMRFGVQSSIKKRCNVVCQKKTTPVACCDSGAGRLDDACVHCEHFFGELVVIVIIVCCFAVVV